MFDLTFWQTVAAIVVAWVSISLTFTALGPVWGFFSSFKLFMWEFLKQYKQQVAAQEKSAEAQEKLAGAHNKIAGHFDDLMFMIQEQIDKENGKGEGWKDA